MNNFDFSQPNKLEKKALWLVLATSFWTIIKAIWPMLAIFAIKGVDKVPYWFYLIFLGVVVITFFRLYINYQFYSYQILYDELIINKGWLNKSKTVIKLDKIHEVNLSQKLIHKIVGLYFVSVDSAGSSKTEITIDGVSYQKALALKDVLTKTNDLLIKQSHLKVNEIQNTEITTNINDEVENNATISISFSSLFKIGFTRNYLQTIGLLIAFSFQIIDQIQDAFYTDDEEGLLEHIVSVDTYDKFGYFVGIFLLLGLILFIIIFNLIRTIVTYYNYKINLKNNQLIVSFGLTDSHIIAVPSNRVQLLKIQQNYFQKLMNLFEVKIKQIESDEDNKKKKGLVVPGANFNEVSKIFQVIFNTSLTNDYRCFKQHKGIIYRKIIRLIVLLFILALAFYYSEVMGFIWILPVVFIVSILFIWIAYRNQKLQITNNFVVLKSGIWDVTTTYLNISKIQQVSVRQNYFQQKRNVATLTLSTAAGDLDLIYYDFNLLQNLADEIIYKIEKDKLKWM